jgi:hypothetical protein
MIGRWKRLLDADGPRGHFEGKLRDLRGLCLTSVGYWDV